MPWFRPRSEQVELGGPEAISISALAKKLGVSQPAPYKHFADRETLLTAVTAEAFRQFNAMLREAIEKPSKRSKLSRLAQATFDFGLRRNGIYRLMFASRIMACAPKGSELHSATMETFDLLLEALEAPAVGLLRERSALKIWAALHGVVMLAEQGLLTGELANVSREELVEDIVEQAKLALSVAIKPPARKRPAPARRKRATPHMRSHGLRGRCLFSRPADDQLGRSRAWSVEHDFSRSMGHQASRHPRFGLARSAGGAALGCCCRSAFAAWPWQRTRMTTTKMRPKRSLPCRTSISTCERSTRRCPQARSRSDSAPRPCWRRCRTLPRSEPLTRLPAEASRSTFR